MKTRLLAAECALVLASFPLPAGAADPGATANFVVGRTSRELSGPELDAVTAGEPSLGNFAAQLRCDLCTSSAARAAAGIPEGDIMQATKDTIQRMEAEAARDIELVTPPSTSGTPQTSGSFMRGDSFNR